MDSHGAAAGLIVAVVVIVALVACLGYFFILRPAEQGGGAPQGENEPGGGQGGEPSISLTVQFLESEGCVKLTWTEYSGTDFISYGVYRSMASGDIGELENTIADSRKTSTMQFDLSPEVTYYFTIRVNRSGAAPIDSNQVGFQLPEKEKENVPGGGENQPPGRSGPYYHQIYSATSTDGINWTFNENLIFDHASVPGAVYFNGKLYVYFVNASDPEHEKLSVGISEDRGRTFTVHDIHISGSNSPYPVDPNPIIDGNKIRLTYLGNLRNPINIVTASSTDGINFTEDAVIFTAQGRTSVFDPDLFYDDVAGEWVLLMNPGQGLIKAVGSSSTSTFVIDPSFSWVEGSISSTVKIGNKFYTYYAWGGTSIAEYSNGRLTVVARMVVDGGDPTVAIFGPNDYIMFVKRIVEPS
ncbi:MAG: hypothetical protein QXG10_04925 [Candidatus Hadarchaeales archaeon]